MSILLRPLVTEKFTKLGEKNKQYGFVVDNNANKLEIKKAVEEMYGVVVLNVNTMIYLGKKNRRYTRTAVLSGKKADTKKAIVTVSPNDTIDFFSSV
ncbi:MAG: 50S ribosomal protein L23 [Bacteroidetes bacterium]|nr:50S ribosomal protein L23 [Bacteroidota bacterium]